jgi:hypothetical protein
MGAPAVYPHTVWSYISLASSRLRVCVCGKTDAHTHTQGAMSCRKRESEANYLKIPECFFLGGYELRDARERGESPENPGCFT